ncbi:MAG: hypothetical protein AAGL49_05225 [Pseudomonadota bacterium]
MTAVVTRADVAALLWRVLLQFEALAERQYTAYAPDLAGQSKRDLIEALTTRAAPARLLETTQLRDPVSQLLARAAGDDKVATLMTQGLVLEQLGAAIYLTARRSDLLSEQDHALAGAGYDAALEVNRRAMDAVGRLGRDGEELVADFDRATGDVISRLADLGDAVDAEFASLDISFADLLGEFSAELIDQCIDLGMPRRRLVVALTNRLMGL